MAGSGNSWYTKTILSKNYNVTHAGSRNSWYTKRILSKNYNVTRGRERKQLVRKDDNKKELKCYPWEGAGAAGIQRP